MLHKCKGNYLHIKCLRWANLQYFALLALPVSADMSQFLQIPAKDKSVSVTLNCLEPQLRFM